VVELCATIGSDNTTSVTLEGGLVGLDGDRDWTKVDCSFELIGIVGNNVIERLDRDFSTS
jgi:hypothetical protein